ncbi:MAG TPA: chemotaxis protein CheW [Polyangiaceae bacterium]
MAQEVAALLARLGSLQAELVGLRRELVTRIGRTQLGDTKITLLVCRAEQQRFGLPIQSVDVVVPVAELAPLPESAPWVVGALNHHGTSIVVVDVRQRFEGEPHVIASSELIVICGTAWGRVGLLVDEVVDVLTVNLEDVDEPAAGVCFAKFLVAVVQEPGGSLPLVEVSKLAAECWSTNDTEFAMKERDNADCSPSTTDDDRGVRALPFRLYSLGTEEMEVVNRTLSRWVEETGFARRSYVQVAAEYARYCSAPKPTRRGIELATEYLAWFLCLNDLPSDDYKRSTLRDVRGVCQGNDPLPRPESRATQNFLTRLAAELPGVALDRFRRRMLAMFDAFEWEAEWLQRGRGVPALDEYLVQREHLIAHFPYIELWRLTEGAEIEGPEAWEALERVEAANTRVIFWVNDILSTERDARKGKINLVECIAQEEGCPRATALEHAHQRLEQAVGAYVEERACLLRFTVRGAGIERHVQFLDSVLEGNRVATVALHDRFWGAG